MIGGLLQKSSPDITAESNPRGGQAAIWVSLGRPRTSLLGAFSVFPGRDMLNM